MNPYLKFAYAVGAQAAREKFASRGSSETPAWGRSGAPLASGYKPPSPESLSRSPMTTQGLPPKSPLGTPPASAPTPSSNSTLATGVKSTATTADTMARPLSGTGAVHNTAAGVDPNQHAWNQQASRTSAGDAPATVTANKDVADVNARGNQNMAQILRETSGNPGAPAALTNAQRSA